MLHDTRPVRVANVRAGNRPAAVALLLLSFVATASAQDITFTERCELEVHDLHTFFQEWSVAELPDTDATYARLGQALAPNFTMVTPEGGSLGRAAVVGGLREAHGRWPGGGTIEVSEVEPVHVLGDVAVLTYVEHQDFDAGDERRMSRRRSTVVFRNEEGAPNGVRWLHVHETWLAPPHEVGTEPGAEDQWHHSGEHGTGHTEHGIHTKDHDQAHGHHGAHDCPGFQHDFSDVERWAKIFDDSARVAWQKPEHVLDLLQIEPGMHVADLGAGTGFFLGYLSLAVGEHGRVQALDIADSLVDHMRQRAAGAGWSNVEARPVAPDDPAFEPGSMDRILIVDVWHHISNRIEYSAKLRRALSADGRVLVVDFTRDSPEGPPPQHRIPPEKVVAELEAAGLKAWIVEDEDLPRQYVVVASQP
ncbi:MAG: DUF4440 domain-containing protein [Thermoanaerobaculia bacterium]|nr:DUF4440 domain-containing protein [Thermoanaerobaculia bacterium]